MYEGDAVVGGDAKDCLPTDRPVSCARSASQERGIGLAGSFDVGRAGCEEPFQQGPTVPAAVSLMSSLAFHRPPTPREEVPDTRVLNDHTQASVARPKDCLSPLVYEECPQALHSHGLAVALTAPSTAFQEDEATGGLQAAWRRMEEKR